MLYKKYSINIIFPFVANLRTLRQNNEQGVNVSPRDEPPPVETRFQAVPNEPYLSPRQGNTGQPSPMMQAAAGRIYVQFSLNLFFIVIC